MVYLICGKSGVGKSTLVKNLIDECDIEPIITCTTRPPREGEVDGIDYHFITKEQFDELNTGCEFMEYASYKVANGETWYYGSLFKDFLNNKNRIIIVNPDGIKVIRTKCKNYGIDTMVIMLTANKKTRLKRLNTRGDNKDEVLRRMQADDEDFKGMWWNADYVINTSYKSQEQTLKKLKAIVR